MDGEDKTMKNLLLLIVGFVIVGLIAVFTVGPLWNVWAKELDGKAQLAEATYNRQIAVQEAEAKKEAAHSLAEAEVIRAEGVAKANKIIGDSLNNNEAYLKYLWIDAVHDQEHQIIYVPTEASIPILEAGKR